jgi:uncharacterized protein
MNLKQRINEDMKAAMRARDSARLSTIRLLLAAIKQREVDERIEADDAVVLMVIEKLLKQRKDSIEQFRAAARHDLADRESAEHAQLSEYLPARVGEAELLAAVDAAIASVAATGPQAMGKVMAVLKSQLAGRADMTEVSALVKRRLSPQG